MTIVEGQIEPLKRLKKILNQSNITRFNSIAEINNFIKNYNSERNEIPKTIKKALNDEIRDLQSEHDRRQKIYDDLKSNISNEVNQNIKDLKENIKQIRKKGNRGFINKIASFLKVKTLENKKLKLENNFGKIIHDTTRIEGQEAVKSKNNLDEYLRNREVIISEGCARSYKKIDHTKEVVDGLYTLIAGAIGESSVVKELQKLSDSYILFNDFSIKFNLPIYNKNENE